MNHFLPLALLLFACSSKPVPSLPAPGEDPVVMPSPSSVSPVEATAEPATPSNHDHGATSTPEPTETPEAIAARKINEARAAERLAFEEAKPVFEKHCARCHTAQGRKTSPKKLSHFDMSTYPFAGHHGMTIAQEIRRTLAIVGNKATMPMDDKGAVTGAELTLIARWADAFDAAHAAGAHGPGHAGHHGH